jgi:hypothetical protein
MKEALGKIATLVRPWVPALGFVSAFVFLDALVNARYPGPEPPFWYVVPSLDVLVLLAIFALLGWRGRPVPRVARFGVLGVLLLLRLVRFGDGVSLRFFDRPFNLYIQLPLIRELPRLATDSMSKTEVTLGIAAFVVVAALVPAARCVLSRTRSHFLPRRRGAGRCSSFQAC